MPHSTGRLSRRSNAAASERQRIVTEHADDPRAVCRMGRIVDEVPPRPRTQGRRTVNGTGLLIGPGSARRDGAGGP
ncbi:hypothetical protein [Streptomyces sp. MMG1121]|uniref:hypothetical protein n=1 Tax=Streptomyces sp. MMG1121 TaxID=1415544 RepID=UPI0006AF31EC|nr:hypothetical protein [Streptomyces sp. MMG1121]